MGGGVGGGAVRGGGGGATLPFALERSGMSIFELVRAEKPALPVGRADLPVNPLLQTPLGHMTVRSRWSLTAAVTSSPPTNQSYGFILCVCSTRRSERFKSPDVSKKLPNKIKAHILCVFIQL